MKSAQKWVKIRMERALERDARSSENGAPLDAPSYVYFFAALVGLALLVLLRAPLRGAVFFSLPGQS